MYMLSSFNRQVKCVAWILISVSCCHVSKWIVRELLLYYIFEQNRRS